MKKIELGDQTTYEVWLQFERSEIPVGRRVCLGIAYQVADRIWEAEPSHATKPLIRAGSRTEAVQALTDLAFDAVLKEYVPDEEQAAAD